MPTISVGTKKEIDVPALVLLLDDARIKMVGIEIQHAMPKQGVSSMFKIGKGYGILIGVLAALKKPYVEIRASEWQKEMFKGLPKSDTKDLSKKIAQQIYPHYDFKATSRCKITHNGMTDATMICVYTRRRFG